MLSFPKRCVALAALSVCAVTMAGLVGCGTLVSFGPGDCARDAKNPEAPCASLVARIKTLKPGETLRLKPGTYDIGFSRLDDVRGTSSKPIQVMAEDFAQRPVLKGWLSLWNVQYLTLDHLRFQANYTKPDHSGPGGGLSIICGVGWKVQNSEFFGAEHTQAFWNFLINGSRTIPPAAKGKGDCPGQPAKFSVTGNVFRDARVTNCNAADTPYHHIYANFAGDSSTSGTISRNIFAGARCGSGIKLGTGSDARPIGAWHVRIEYNTFYGNARAIILQNKIVGTVFNRNLMDRTVYPHSINPHVPVALGTVAAQSPANVISHTYASNNLNPNQRVWGPIRNDGIGVLTAGCDNAFRSGGDPQWNSTNPAVANSFKPANKTAAAYGRYGTGSLAC